jgi:hypothetical protein
MPQPATTTTAPESEPFRVPDHDLGDLASTLAATAAEVRRHRAILDRLAAEPTAETGAMPDASGTSVFIVALRGEKYAAELAALAKFDEDVAEKTRAEIRVVAAMRDHEVRRVALRASGLSTSSLDMLSTVIEQARRLEGLPPDEGGLFDE